MTRILIVLTLLGLCISCGTGDSETKQTTAGKIVFSDVTKDRGLNYKHVASLTKEKYMPEVLGSGVAVADFNNDGSPDIYFANSGKYGAVQRPDDAKDRLFLNDGKGRFTDRSAQWKVSGRGYGFGVTAGDIDNDGNTDIFLTNFEGDNRLLRNTGTSFEDVTEAAGIKPDGKWASSAGFGDFDNDGDLDLFIVKYVVYNNETKQDVYRNRMLTYSAPLLYAGIDDQILENDGTGKFTDISEKAGITGTKQKGLALAIGDIDRDGDADVYVANDTTPNQLWINDGTGKFRDVARLSGSAYSENGREEGSMGADFSDFDSNGLLDIAVTNFQDESTAVYTQTDKLLFRDTSDAIGIGVSSRAALSFGLDFFDADNDGDEDLLVANGHIDDTIESHSESITFAQQNSLYENTGNKVFNDISNNAGDALKQKAVSRGLAIADFDNDGDLDFVIANNNAEPQLAYNETAEKGNFVGILLTGEKSNRNAIGARLKATIGEKTIEREVMGSQSYLSLSEFRVLFGLGDAAQIDKLEIKWPGGETQVLQNIKSGTYYSVSEGGRPKPLFGSK